MDQALKNWIDTRLASFFLCEEPGGVNTPEVLDMIRVELSGINKSIQKLVEVVESMELGK